MSLRRRVVRRIEVVEISEEIPERVADLPVRLGLLEDLGETFMSSEIDLGHPEAEDVRAESLRDLDRRDDVAERLRHLLDAARLRVEVEREPVCQNLAVGRPAARPHTDEERGVEPAPVLIVPLEIEIRGPGEAA
jgi:hypothetical protein